MKPPKDKLPSLSFIHFVLMMIGMIHQCKREGLLVVIIWHEIMDLISDNSKIYIPHLISAVHVILSRFYPDFIQILS